MYNLGRMRTGKEYLAMTTLVKMKRVSEKYMIQGTVDDQDWLTVLGWEMENMFYILPCQFNVQMDKVYKTEEYKGVRLRQGYFIEIESNILLVKKLSIL